MHEKVKVNMFTDVETGNQKPGKVFRTQVIGTGLIVCRRTRHCMTIQLCNPASPKMLLSSKEIDEDVEIETLTTNLVAITGPLDSAGRMGHDGVYEFFPPEERTLDEKSSMAVRFILGQLAERMGHTCLEKAWMDLQPGMDDNETDISSYFVLRGLIESAMKRLDTHGCFTEIAILAYGK